MTPEEKRQRAIRAREVIDGAGWLFDEYANAEMAAILKSDPMAQDGPEKRESHYRRAAAAAEMKLGLLALIQNYEAEVKLDERRSDN